MCLHVCLLLSGASASDLVLQCTPEGIRLQCYMNYYTEEMKTIWKHKYSLNDIFECNDIFDFLSNIYTLTQGSDISFTS